jgi:two-component sensor histidine kinase
VDSANGNYVSAIKHFQAYKDLNDTLFNQAKSKQIEELMIQYETEKKDRNISVLENESKLQKGELEHANQTRNWIIGVALLFFIIIALLINNARLKEQANKKLQAQQKEIEKKNLLLQHLVKEKDWLVKEIHHRVKNNFHIVAGLLRTQSEYLQTAEAIKAVTESQLRGHSMSLIHQKLYQSDNLSAINMVEYIHELVEYLKDSFNIRQSIHFNLQIDRVEMALSHCIPLGLILNEAITNSIKYGFPGNKSGIVNISFKRISQERFQLTINDNGIGLPSNADLFNSASMGMRLMKGLSDDIEGKFTINNHINTEIIIEFIYNPERANGVSKPETNITV